MITIHGQQYYALRLRPSRSSGVDVIGLGTYPSTEQLAGQTFKAVLGHFPTEGEARREFPQVDGWLNKHTPAHIVTPIHYPDNEGADCD